MMALEEYEKETSETRLNRVSTMSTVLNIGIQGKNKDIGLKLGDKHDIPALIHAVANALVILQKNIGMGADEILDCTYREINNIVKAEFEQTATIH